MEFFQIIYNFVHNKISKFIGQKKRNKYTPNEIIDNLDGSSYICLYNIKNEEVARAIIDTSDVELVKGHKWCKDRNGYVKDSKQQYLHRLILSEYNQYIDHIDGNKLDNRRNNLRACSNANNLKNRVNLPSNNTSGILGVRFRKDRNKWYAELKADGVVYRLGSYVTKEEAIKARLDGELKCFGKYKSKVLNNETN